MNGAEPAGRSQPEFRLTRRYDVANAMLGFLFCIGVLAILTVTFLVPLEARSLDPSGDGVPQTGTVTGGFLIIACLFSAIMGPVMGVFGGRIAYAVRGTRASVVFGAVLGGTIFAIVASILSAVGITTINP